MKRPLLPFVVGALMLLAPACGPGITGSGYVVSETRPVPAYSSLEVHDGLSASLTVGPRSVTVRADDNLLPYLETFVRGDTLVVRERPGISLYRSHVQVVLTNDVLRGVDATGGSQVTAEATASPSFALLASGGSDVVVDGLSAGELTLDASGGSQVQASGAAANLILDDSGGSQVHARSLVAQTADLEVSGGSFLEVTVVAHVTGEASGGSHVTVYGRPTGHLEATGGSTLIWAGD